MKYKQCPPLKELKQTFTYFNGVLYWNTRTIELCNFNHHEFIRWNNRYANTKAGHLSEKGYLRVKLNGEKYSVHRIIWKLFNDIDSDIMIDHIDGNPLNNNINNLREATNSQNQQNSKKSSANSSGIKGISWDKRLLKWKVDIRVNGKYTYLGVYESLDVATKIINDARERFHGDFANHGK